MENEITLKELRGESGEVIMDWQFEEIASHVYARIYLNPREDKNGFDFFVVEWAGSEGGKPIWGPDSNIGVAFHGGACFDGIRHLYMGYEQTKDEGYYHYPDMDHFIVIFAKLKELIKRYCNI